MCPHGIRFGNGCDTWFCRYPALIERHGYVDRSISMASGWALSIFTDGHKVFTYRGLCIARPAVPASITARLES